MRQDTYSKGRKMNIETLDAPFELKALEESGVIEGYGSTFGNVDRGGDVVDPTAFDDAIKSGVMPKMLWQHRRDEVIGVWDQMSRDSQGLQMKGRLLLDLPRAKEAYVLLKNKAISGLSIGYITRDYKMEGDKRRLLKVDLKETSVVTFPMNESATVTTVKTELVSVRDVERILREGGVPANFAKLVAAHGLEEAKSILDRRDGELDQATARQALRALKQLKEKFHAKG